MKNNHVHPLMANLVEDIKRFSLPPRPPAPPTQWAEETVYVGQLDYTVPAPVAAELSSLRRQLAAEVELYCDVRACLDQERMHHRHRTLQLADLHERAQGMRQALEAAAAVLDSALCTEAAEDARQAARA